jgi:DinB superfamily
VATAAGLLREQWTASSEALLRIVSGLTDEEFFWQPCPVGWTVRADASRPGAWIIDYPDIPPDPPPFTTVAWRLLHITHGNWIYWEHAFGPHRRNFSDLEIMSSAQRAVVDLASSQRPVADALSGLDDETLDELRPTPLGRPLRARDVFSVLLNEQVHHGAEISLLRDLFRHPECFAGRQ